MLHKKIQLIENDLICLCSVIHLTTQLFSILHFVAYSIKKIRANYNNPEEPDLCFDIRTLYFKKPLLITLILSADCLKYHVLTHARLSCAYSCEMNN